MEKLLFVPNYLLSCSLGVYYFRLAKLCFLCVLTANNRVVRFFLLRCCFYGISRISESLRSSWRLAGIKLLIIKTLFTKKKLESSGAGQAALRGNGFYDKTFCGVEMVEQWVVERSDQFSITCWSTAGRESQQVRLFKVLCIKNDRIKERREMTYWFGLHQFIKMTSVNGAAENLGENLFSPRSQPIRGGNGSDNIIIRSFLFSFSRVRFSSCSFCIINI